MSDGAVITEMIKQSPIAVAIIFTMMIFLKSMDRRDKEFAARQEQWFSMWREVVQSNTTVLGQVIEKLGGLRK
jgi:hypothetical protein